MTTWDLGGDGGNSFPFDNIGDHVSGTVLDLTQRQQTDMDNGQPAFWDNGDPKMMSIVTLQTELRDPTNPADDGKRTVALMGSKKPGAMSRMAAVLDAVRAATGSSALQYGGKLTIQYVGNGQQTRKGYNPPKQYQAWYEAPAMQLDQPAEHKSAPPAPAGPAFGAQQGPPPDWAQPQQPPVAPPQSQPAADPWAAAQQPPVTPPAVAQPPTGPPAAPPAAPPQAAPQATPATAPTGATAAAGQAGQPVTREQVAALQNIGVDPAQVYGPDWQSRLA